MNTTAVPFTAVAIFEYCNEFDGYFGLRVQEDAMEIGKVLPNSYSWSDEGRGEELNGTCAVGLNGYGDEVTLESVQRAMREIGQYCGEHIALVWSQTNRFWLGEDVCEVILEEASPLLVWEKN